MTQKEYNFLKNARIVAITLIGLVLLYDAFALFQDGQIDFGHIASPLALIISLLCIIFNKPTPPQTS